MKIFKTYFFLLIAIFFSSCQKESALSDIDLTDPSLVRIEIKLEHEESLVFGITQRILTYVLDKNNDVVEIKNGEIKVENTKLTLSKDPFNLPYYALNSEQVQIMNDSTYNFTITLSDQKEYKAEVTTPKNRLYNFIVPEQHSATNDLEISWENTNENEMQLKGTKYINKNGTIKKKSFNNINVPNPESGKYTFPTSFFHETDGQVTKVDITLESKNFGKIDDNFKAGSFISAIFSIEKSVVVTE